MTAGIDGRHPAKARSHKLACIAFSQKDKSMSRANDVFPSELETNNGPDVLWGAPSIARVINKSIRATYYLLENKIIPANKAGGQWVASRRRLLNFLGDSTTIEAPTKEVR
jgi:hypothetical protein